MLETLLIYKQTFKLLDSGVFPGLLCTCRPSESPSKAVQSRLERLARELHYAMKPWGLWGIRIVGGVDEIMGQRVAHGRLGKRGCDPIKPVIVAAVEICRKLVQVQPTPGKQWTGNVQYHNMAVL